MAFWVEEYQVWIFFFLTKVQSAACSSFQHENSRTQLGPPCPPKKEEHSKRLASKGFKPVNHKAYVFAR
jgi:hypothetical protein